MKHKAKCTIAIAGSVAVLAAVGSVFAITASGNICSISIVSVPKNVVSGTVTYCDAEWNPQDTDATVSIVSNQTASVDKLSESGYYTVTFFSETAEIGKAEFFLGESGKVYSYDYVYNEDAGEYTPSYTVVSNVVYTAYDCCRILDIGGTYQATAIGLSDETASVWISVALSNGDYGERTDSVKVDNNGECVISNLGVAGNYWVEFLDNDQMALGYAAFYMDENGKLYTEDYEYNSATGEWEKTMAESDVVYFESNDEGSGFESAEDDDIESTYSVTVQGVPTTVASVETQYVDNALNQIDSYLDVTIVGDGTVQADGLYNGYYTFNFYDSSYSCIGYTAFYMDENGVVYSYDALTKLDTLSYSALEQEKSYTYGNMNVSVYGVPEEIDSVEGVYFVGEDIDETILFEPELSSVYTEPLIVSSLGMKGKYKLNFYIDNEIVGNAEFYLDVSGKLYDYDYEYNSSSGEWEEVLVEADCAYYFENTDIEDADDYNYSNIKLTITNVPTDVKYAEISYFENDDTYTAGNPIFPNTTISGKGTVVVSNLGEEGYYEAELLKSDGKTKIGYVFFYIDGNSDIYLIEYSINSDTYQVETTMTKMSSIPLTEYMSSTIEYVTGNKSVTIYDVPVTVNRILVACTTPDGEYATYETEVTVQEDSTAVLKNLGMEGDYTVTFLTDKNYTGSATFYLKADGTICEAEYSYSETGDISINLTKLNKVIFIPSSEIISYEAGDIDFSGSITIADAVILQKYLLNSQTISASQYNIADLTDDGAVNVFDLVILKRKLLKVTN